MLSALGGVKPAWEQQQPATPRREGMPVSLVQDLGGSATRPYHVGRARARGQLSRALETQNDAAQLRRLQQCLQSPVTQYEDGGRRAVQEASDQVTTLSARLQATADTVVPLDTSDYFQTPRRGKTPRAQPKAAAKLPQPPVSAPAAASTAEVPAAPPAPEVNLDDEDLEK